MKFQVTDIEFDFTGCLETHGSYELPVEEQLEIINQTRERVWIAEDEDDLTDEITWETGWCIKSLDYTIIPDETVKLKNGNTVTIC